MSPLLRTHNQPSPQAFGGAAAAQSQYPLFNQMQQPPAFRPPAPFAPAPLPVSPFAPHAAPLPLRNSPSRMNAFAAPRSTGKRNAPSEHAHAKRQRGLADGPPHESLMDM